MLYMSIVHSMKHTEFVHNSLHQWCDNEFHYVEGFRIVHKGQKFYYSAVSLVSGVALTFGIWWCSHLFMKVGNAKCMTMASCIAYVDMRDMVWYMKGTCNNMADMVLPKWHKNYMRPISALSNSLY